MSNQGNQIVCTYMAHQRIDAVDITAMLALDNSYIIIADKKTRRLQLYNQQLDVESEYQIEKAGWYGVIDLTEVEPKEFAGLVPGIFWASEVRVYRINKYNQINQISCIKVDRRSYGLSFYKERFFVATSPELVHVCGPKKQPVPGHIKMIDGGQVSHTFYVDQDNKPLFSRQISKIHVTSQFTMYVCDAGKKELLILQVEERRYGERRYDEPRYKVTILASHNYDVVHICSIKDSSCFLATNNKDGVVLLHENGKWVFNNILTAKKLEGHPKSVACLQRDQQHMLLAVVQKSKWFPLPTSWLELCTYSLENHSKNKACKLM